MRDCFNAALTAEVVSGAPARSQDAIKLGQLNCETDKQRII